MSRDADSEASAAPILSVDRAELRFGQRVVWHNLSLDVAPGEFVAVLGPNGTGKTSLLKVLLGQHSLHAGSVRLDGRPVSRGDRRVGYIPQQRGVEPHTPMRGRDLVRMGVDGHKWGPAWLSPRNNKEYKARVDELLASVGALEYADAPAGTLSGGELQRLRVAQALADDPDILLCDEPLLSLDITQQHRVAHLIDEKRRERNTAVLFVTHEINPILPYVDKVLYIAGGHFLVGTPDDVINTESLSALYGTHVEVVRVAGRLVIVGVEEDFHPTPAEAGAAAPPPAAPSREGDLA